MPEDGRDGPGHVVSPRRTGLAGLPEPPWRSAPRRSSPPRPQLSREVIVAAAIEVIEAAGGESLTMRRVADRLGASASSLYGYVASKEELIQLVLDRLFAEISLPPPGGRWQDALTEFCRTVLDMYRRHPGVAGLTLGRVAVTPSMLPGLERMLAGLRSAGLPDQVVAYVGDLVGLYVGGFAYELEVAPPADAAHFPAQFSGWLKSLPPDQFPNVIALADKLVAGSADDRFEWGMDIIVRGLASYLTSPPAAGAGWPPR